MYSVIVIPTLISETVHDNLVPFISKLIERNTALNYQDYIRETIELKLVEEKGDVKKGWIERIFGERESTSFSRDYIFNNMEKHFNIECNILSEKDLRKKMKDPKYIEETFAQAAPAEHPSKKEKRENEEEKKRSLENKIKEIEARMDSNREEAEKIRNTIKKLISDYNGAKEEEASNPTSSRKPGERAGDFEARLKAKKLELDSLNSEFQNLLRQLDKYQKDKLLDYKIAKDIRDEEDRIEKDDEIFSTIYVTMGDRSAERGDIGRPEVPKGINMYTTISLEPTYLELKITDTRSGGRDQIIRTILIGFKSIPFKVEEASLIDQIQNRRSALNIRKRAVRQLRRVGRRVWKGFWLTRARYINRGRREEDWVVFPGEPGKIPTQDVFWGPDYKELLNPKRLKKFLKPGATIGWGTALVLRTLDFKQEDEDFKQFARDYKTKLVKEGYGDIVILNEEKEIVHFCSIYLKYCQKLNFSYLKQILNVGNLIDYSERNRRGSPFGSVM